MGVFSKVFKSRDGASKKNGKENGAAPTGPPKPRWEGDAWERKTVDADEIQELLSGCTNELKSRALDMPFLLLPFRPASDPSAARTFVRNYFTRALPTSDVPALTGPSLSAELRLTEPLVLASVMKWCWSRLAGGIVTWEAYELFKIGEQGSAMARDSFATFLPMVITDKARVQVVFDFFDLLAAVAAHGKTNGLRGRALARLAGWWAFEHNLEGKEGFDGGYKSWTSAADATSHLFFAYLRSLSSDSIQGKKGIYALPLSLTNLVETTEYPPTKETALESRTTKVVMVVDSVSPTPFALLRRVKNFEYREDDVALQQFASYEDPVSALTDECRRVLKSISSVNDSSTTKNSTSLKDPSWSRFEDMGFDGLEEIDGTGDESALGPKRVQPQQGLRTTAQSTTNLGRPTTPSWADFLSSGFVDDKAGNGTLLLPPDKILPPINRGRQHSSQSNRRESDKDSVLEPGELASINYFGMDDVFWWVWISSLAGEETLDRKKVFGRCALIETNIHNGKWLVLEEVIKGAAPEPDANAYIAEKKSRFGFSSRRKGLTRSQSKVRDSFAKAGAGPYAQSRLNPGAVSKTSITPEQQARIEKAAVALQQKHQQEAAASTSPRRGRQEDSAKTNSVFTLQPIIMSEAAPAMKWASSYDKNTVRAKYLGDDNAGRGSNLESVANGAAPSEHTSAAAPTTRAKVEGYPAKSMSSTNILSPESAPAPIAKSNAQEVAARLVAPGEAPAPLSPQWQPQKLVGQQLAAAIRPSQTESPILPKEKVQTMGSNNVTPMTPPKNNAGAAAADMNKPMPPQPRQENFQPSVPAKDLPPKDMVTVQALSQPRAAPQPPTQPSPQPADSQARHNSATGVTDPESPNKLRKRNLPPPNRLKGLFGRKKAAESAPAPELEKDTKAAQPQLSGAVAAARAALEAKNAAVQSTAASPPRQVKVAQRISLIGRKEAPSESPVTEAKSTAPAATLAAAPVMQAYGSGHRSESYEQGGHWDSDGIHRKVSRPDDDVSVADTAEERRAEEEFRKFDHDPHAENQPSFDNDMSPVSTRHGTRDGMHDGEGESRIQTPRMGDDVRQKLAAAYNARDSVYEDDLPVVPANEESQKEVRDRLQMAYRERDSAQAQHPTQTQAPAMVPTAIALAQQHRQEQVQQHAELTPQRAEAMLKQRQAEYARESVYGDEQMLAATQGNPAVAHQQHASVPTAASALGHGADPFTSATKAQEPAQSVTSAVDTAAVQDRWAQIRKNAAQRAAQHGDMDQSRMSTGGNVDGNGTAPGGVAGTSAEEEVGESGEDTIDRRVARIKARVAELTGNMEAPSAAAARRPVS